PYWLRIVFSLNDSHAFGIYTLSLHDALPISRFETTRPPNFASIRPPAGSARRASTPVRCWFFPLQMGHRSQALPRRAGLRKSGVDRKSTRLNSSHDQISYAVFCLKKKTKKQR